MSRLPASDEARKAMGLKLPHRGEILREGKTAREHSKPPKVGVNRCVTPPKALRRSIARNISWDDAKKLADRQGRETRDSGYQKRSGSLKKPFAAGRGRHH